MAERPKKISCGHYTYRGHDIRRYDGRGLTRWRWVWEIVDKNRAACGHWQTLEMCVLDIDDYFKDEFIRYLEDLRKRFGDELYLHSSDIELGSSIIVSGDNVTVYIHDDDGDDLKEEEVSNG